PRGPATAGPLHAWPGRERTTGTSGRRVGVKQLHPDRWSLACLALAALTAGAYVALHPASPDLAAQAFRADLVADHGLVLWDGQWYGGHSTAAYRLVAPAVVAALGLWVPGALAIVVSVV